MCSSHFYPLLLHSYIQLCNMKIEKSSIESIWIIVFQTHKSKCTFQNWLKDKRSSKEEEISD